MVFNKSLRSRHWVICIGLAVAALAEPSTGAETTSEAFFRPAPDESRDRDPYKVYPQGRIFPLGFYGLNPAKDKPEGLTLLGPYGRESNVAAAREHGLKCTYTISLPMRFHEEKPLELTDDEIRRQVRKQVDAAAKNPEIAWWYLAPEELRYWRKNEMTYLKVAAATIRQIDPLRRPVWMYDPNHRDAAALARTVEHLDICGKGMYTNYSGRRENRVWVRWTMEQEIEAIRRANPKAVPIAVPEMFQEPPEDSLAMIPRWARHDVYLSLVSGAKGIMVFSGWRRPKFPAFDRYCQAYAVCAREINGPLNLGQIFLFGQRRGDIRVRLLDGPARVSTAGNKPVRYPSVAMLDVAHGQGRYLFLVNSANKPVRLMVEGLPQVLLVVESLFDRQKQRITRRGQFEQTLEGLEVKAFRFARGPDTGPG